MKLLTYLLFSLTLFSSCAQKPNDNPEFQQHPQFGDYWYAGEAELSSYELEQVRYGETHQGTAVLIFVTEPFSKSKQVKLDRPGEAKDDEVTVMKLNFTKKFLTGIYPYSMMMSSFVPVSLNSYPDALKITSSVQEWCGHTFTQVNLKGSKYKGQLYSYFESEGDTEFHVPNQWTEDELWQRIRLAPDLLPTGSLDILPSTLYQRLGHSSIKLLKAEATISLLERSDFSDQPHRKYMLTYPDRTMSIYFEEAFPFQILGWEETYKSGFKNPTEMTTRARLKKSIKSPYWQQNGADDRIIREQLELSTEY